MVLNLAVFQPPFPSSFSPSFLDDHAFKDFYPLPLTGDALPLAEVTHVCQLKTEASLG
jgi:hypothetical protein